MLRNVFSRNSGSLLQLAVATSLPSIAVGGQHARSYVTTSILADIMAEKIPEQQVSG